MANSSGGLYGGGFRQGRIYALNPAGRIFGNSPTVPYEGVTLIGAKTFALNEQKMRVLNHMGSDRVQAADFLPPTAVSEATINVSAVDHAVHALITGTKTVINGEMSALGHLTSQQGYEPIVAILVTQQAEDYSTRLRVWHSYAIARAKLIPHSPQFLDKEADGTLDAVLIPSNVDLFGNAFTTLANGFTDAQYDDWDSEGLPYVNAWLADGTATAFAFMVNGVATPAKSTAKVTVYVNGVITSAGITVTVNSATFAVAPVVNTDIQVKFEY